MSKRKTTQSNDQAEAQEQASNGAVKLPPKSKRYETPCACDCGGMARKAFVSSHDAKLASAIRKVSDETREAVTARVALAFQNEHVAESAYFAKLVEEAGIAI